MSTSDEDADLTRALAMSMDSDAAQDDDEDLRRATALSLQESRNRASPQSSTHMSSPVMNKVDQAGRLPILATACASTTDPSRGFGASDRKAMEEERLARLSKRKWDASPEEPAKRVAKGPDTAKSSQNRTPCPRSPTTSLQYPRGAIKRTFASKYPRTNDITIDELLQAPRIHTAVISSFMWDAEWLQGKLNPAKVKQLWIMNAKDQAVQDRWVHEMEDSGVPNLKLHFPPMHGMIYSMHSKYLLLFGKDKLRFAVPTANMTRIDWGEVANDWQPGVMENSVFLIDLPRLGAEVQGDKAKLTKFGQELVYFLEQQQTPRMVIDGVLKFDFSQTAHLAFVHSIGGTHDSRTARPTGLPSLAHAVRGLQLGDVKQLSIDYAASSLGAVNDHLLQRVHLAASGEEFGADTQPTNVRKDFRVYFPTKEAVEQSVGGPDCGGIISLTHAHYNAATFPRECLRNYDSTRRGMLSHNKLLFARGCKNDGRRVAFVYVGSANLSESAWGGQKVLKSGVLGKLNIKNWECGVVMPVSEDVLSEVECEKGTMLPPMGVFENIVEVPFRYPGTEYGHSQPWYFGRG